MSTTLQTGTVESELSNLPPNSSVNNRSLYICKRIQLLQDTDKKPEKWKNYLKMRSMLLKQHCGSSISKETRTLSKLFSKMNLSDDDKKLDNKDIELTIVSTKAATASKAIVGGNSIAKNYSFTGVHHIFDQHKACVTMVKFANNDSTKLCCSSMDATLSICSASRNPKVLFTLSGHTEGVTCFNWSSNNDIIASCSLDSTVRIWNAQNGECLSAIKSDKSKYFSCAFQPINNNLLFVGTDNGEVRIVNISTGRFNKNPCKLSGTILSLAFNTNGNIVWAGTDKGDIFSIHCDLDGTLTKTKKYSASNSSISSLSFKVWVSREARDPMLLASCTNNTVCIYSVVDEEGTLILKKKFENKHPTFFIKATFCPMMSFREGACIVTGSEDGSIYFLDIEKNSTKACINTLQGHSKPVVDISFNYVESLLATSDLDGLVIVWKRTESPFETETPK